MTNRKQPLDLAYAPPRYPAHNYTGDGEIVTVRAGGELVGYLTRQGDTVSWLPAPDLSDAANTVRVMVWEILAEGARKKQPLINAWAACLDATQHDKPTIGSLAKLTR